MRVLVLGARGMLGTDLLKEWQSDDLIPAGSAEADIRCFAEVQTLVSKVRPDWIIAIPNWLSR
jgi:dTDP-4-dehydrorhamnose reductase